MAWRPRGWSTRNARMPVHARAAAVRRRRRSTSVSRTTSPLSRLARLLSIKRTDRMTAAFRPNPAVSPVHDVRCVCGRRVAARCAPRRRSTIESYFRGVSERQWAVAIPGRRRRRAPRDRDRPGISPRTVRRVVTANEIHPKAPAGKLHLSSLRACCCYGCCCCWSRDVGTRVGACPNPRLVDEAVTASDDDDGVHTDSERAGPATGAERRRPLTINTTNRDMQTGKRRAPSIYTHTYYSSRLPAKLPAICRDYFRPGRTLYPVP